MCDVRRFWQCPACGTTARLAGSETFQRCGCRPQGVWMKLVDPTPPHPAYVPTPSRSDGNALPESASRSPEANDSRNSDGTDNAENRNHPQESDDLFNRFGQSELDSSAPSATAVAPDAETAEAQNTTGESPA